MTAGQRPTTTEQRQSIVTQVLHFNWDPTTGQYHPLFVNDKPFVVEKAVARWATAAGAASTMNLCYAANGVALSTNTDISTAIDANGTADTLNTFPLLPNTTTTGAKTPTSNIVPANALLGLEFDAAAKDAMGIISLTIWITEVLQ